MKYCMHCGKELLDDAKFCPSCGTAQAGGVQNPNNPKNASFMDSFTDGISKMAGGSGPVRPPLKHIFSNIFKKHEQGESEEIFICGTKKTTPVLTDDATAWPTPWLWSRILLVFGAAFLLLYICCSNFENANALPGLMVIGSFMIPVAVLVFFFELNTPKNISIFSVIKYFLIGGCASLVFTLLLYDVFTLELDSWFGAIFVGMVEEIGKLAIVAYVIWKSKEANYTLNGLLIGAAIGAGFAAFESAGYAFNQYAYAGYEAMLDVILLRAFLAPGGHVIWAAMSGYAISFVMGNEKFSMAVFQKSAFWKIFWIPVVLHAVWDMPIAFGDTFIGQILPNVLNMIVGWIVTFVLIGNALSQLGEILQQRKEQSPVL